MGLKIILDAVKSSGGIPRCSDNEYPKYCDNTGGVGTIWYGEETKFAVINYDDANIRIVKQNQNFTKTYRYVLLINQYLVFCDTDVNGDVVGV